MRRFVFFFLLLAGFSGTALAGEARIDAEIAVDVTGKDANEARSMAMAKGEVEGLLDVLGKLSSPAQAQDIINTLDAKKVSAMVRATQVLEEKISASRYRARLLVSFDGDEIAALVSKASGALPGGNLEAPSPVSAFLIIPGYTEADLPPLLWEDSNPWRNAWKTVGLETTTGDVIVPYGDSSDSTLVDAKTLPSANFAALASLTSRYGVSDIVVVQATLQTAPDLVLTVLKRRMTRARNDVTQIIFRADPQETRDLLLIRAAHEIAAKLEHVKSEELNNRKLAVGGEQNKIMIVASNTTLSSWTQLRAKLSALPMIDQLETLAVAPQQVDMEVHYRGAPKGLADAIAGLGIRLVQKQDYWIISKD